MISSKLLIFQLFILALNVCHAEPVPPIPIASKSASCNNPGLDIPLNIPRSLDSSEQCSNSQISDVKFSITSHRNQTGHWITQLQLQREDGTSKPESEQNPSDLWNVDVQQSATQCGGINSLQIISTITAPRIATTIKYPPAATPPIAPPPTPPKVIPGYEHIPGIGYYKFHAAGQTWDGARRLCENEKAHLVIINSEEESTVLQNILSQVPKLDGTNHNDFVYVGFHDRFVEGEYLTIYGKPVSSTGYNRWGQGQPDNAGGNENCGSIHRSGVLNDIPCHWKLAYFCEYELQ